MSDRRKVTVVGAGNVGATCAQVLAQRDYADVVLVDIKEGLPQGKALDINQMGAVLGYEPNVTGSNDYDADGRLRRRRDHRRPPPLAGHEPRRPGDDEREDRQGRDREGRREEPRHDPDRRLEPARRDVPRREERLRVSEGARLRPGRHPRHRAAADVHRLGDRRVGQGRRRGRARRPRRPDGLRRLRDDGRRRADPQARLRGQDRRDGRAHRQGRRRARAADGHLGLVRAGRRVGADGRLDPARREARAALHRLPRGRVRDRRPLHGRAGEARLAGDRADPRGRPRRVRAGGARRLGRRRARGRRRAQYVTHFFTDLDRRTPVPAPVQSATVPPQWISVCAAGRRSSAELRPASGSLRLKRSPTRAPT